MNTETERKNKLYHKINKLNWKSFGRSRLKIVMASLSVIAAILIGFFVWGAIFYKQKFPSATPVITCEGKTITISALGYDTGGEITIHVEASSPEFPDISATYVWFKPLSGRLFWSWRDYEESELEYLLEYIDSIEGTSKRLYKSSGRLSHTTDGFFGLNFEIIVEIHDSHDQIHYLNIVRIQ